MLSLISIWISLFLFFSSLLFLKTKKNGEKYKKMKLVPPSPPKLPFLGHLHLLGSLPHRSLTNLSKQYGPVMLLHLGSVPTIVISSSAAASDLFKLHDLHSCSRPRLAATRRISYNFLDMIFSPYGDRWRELRKISMLELFSTKRVQSFKPIREEEVNLFINSISQSSSSKTPIDLKHKCYSLTANIMTRVAFGKSFRGTELDNENFQEVIQRASVVLGNFSATDFFPTFGWFIDRLSGVHGRLEKSFAELDSFIQEVVDDRRNFTASSQNNEENIVDVLLRMERDASYSNGLEFTRDCIKALVMDLFLAGVETGENIIVWTMAELIGYPRVMKKLQHEIRSSIKETDQVKESDLEKLQYLKVVVKEILRLHPPLPLLLPRETISHFKLNGYDIDLKAQLYVNVWAIGRDPELWENPEVFFPERFMESSVDYKGQNFELIPFGAGRRICPGMNMGILTVELALANLLLCFDWELPNGMKEDDLDMEEEAGIAVGKKSPLKVVPLPYFK